MWAHVNDVARAIAWMGERHERGACRRKSVVRDACGAGESAAKEGRVSQPLVQRVSESGALGASSQSSAPGCPSSGAETPSASTLGSLASGSGRDASAATSAAAVRESLRRAISAIEERSDGRAVSADDLEPAARRRFAHAAYWREVQARLDAADAGAESCAAADAGDTDIAIGTRPLHESRFSMQEFPSSRGDRARRGRNAARRSSTEPTPEATSAGPPSPLVPDASPSSLPSEVDLPPCDDEPTPPPAATGPAATGPAAPEMVRVDVGERIPTGWHVIDELLEGGLPWRGLHEWFGMASTSERAARGVPNAWFAPIGVLVHLVHTAWRALRDRDFEERSAAGEGDARSSGGMHAMWIGRAAWPNPRCLIAGVRGDLHALAAERSHAQASRLVAAPTSRDASLLERSLFVETPPDPAARVWAMEQAIRSEDVRIIVTDASGWSMAALRRLHVAMTRRASPAFALLARPPNDMSQLSLALTRWTVRPVVPTQGPGGDADIPERSIAWCVRLVRCRSSLLGALRPDARRRLLSEVLVPDHPDRPGRPDRSDRSDGSARSDATRVTPRCTPPLESTHPSTGARTAAGDAPCDASMLAFPEASMHATTGGLCSRDLSRSAPFHPADAPTDVRTGPSWEVGG